MTIHDANRQTANPGYRSDIQGPWAIAVLDLFVFHTEECLYELPLGSGSRCTEDSSEFLSRYQAYAPLLAQQVSEFPKTRLLSTSKELCQGDVCSMVSGQMLLFADHGHLNEAGSTHVILGLAESLARGTPD